MRPLTLGTLTGLLLTFGVAPATLAESAVSDQEQAGVSNQPSVRSTEAFDLVASAYRGDLESQGVPSYYELQRAYEAGSLDAEMLVDKAIEAGQLSPAAAEDEGYINAVKLHLDRLTQDRGL